MSNSLREIATDYSSAEISCLVVTDKKTKKFTSLITLIELVPKEQEESPKIGDNAFPYNIRESYDDLTFYFIRIQGLPVGDMLTVFEGAEKEMVLNHKGIHVTITVPYILQPDPPSYQPVMIKAKEEKTIGKLLPRRNTNYRVWSKINIDKSWTKDFDEKFLKKISRLSLKYMEHDFTRTPEHFGNVYLFASNPVLRYWDTALVDLQKDLIVNFYQREGMSLAGGRLILEETRGGNKGFLIDHPVTNTTERISLPYFPDILDITVLDKQDRVIDRSHGAWVNMHIGMNIHQKTVHYTVKGDDGDETFSVDKTSSEQGVSIDKFDRSVSRYLSDELEKRKHEELESNNDFIFLEKGPHSKEKAATAVKWILNKATERCIILDPYFTVKDLLYVYNISNISVPVQVISSAAMLSGYTVREEKVSCLQELWARIKTMLNSKAARPAKLTHADVLAGSIASHQAAFPEQTILCKVLKGSKSPLHDRYLVVNNDVYLLGSSLNEFGNRTTTVIKVPAPQKMIEKALDWWKDDTECITLSEFIRQNQVEKKKKKK